MKRPVPLQRRLPPMLALALLLGGCAAPVQPTVNPALFPRDTTASASASKVAGRVALLVPPQVLNTLGKSGALGGTQPGVEVPIGRIVEKAALLTLGDTVNGSVDPVDAAPDAQSGYSATLVIENVACVRRVRILWMLPMPYLGAIGEDETSVQVTFDVRVLDAQARSVWTHTYDSGRQVWEHRLWANRESYTDGIARLAHEGAWRLMQHAVTDLRDWLASERIKAREL